MALEFTSALKKIFTKLVTRKMYENIQIYNVYKITTSRTFYTTHTPTRMLRMITCSVQCCHLGKRHILGSL